MDVDVVRREILLDCVNRPLIGCNISDSIT
jgi:hypothetical protein